MNCLPGLLSWKAFVLSVQLQRASAHYFAEAIGDLGAAAAARAVACRLIRH